MGSACASTFSSSRTRFCPCSNFGRNDVFNLIFVEWSTVVRVQPTTLDWNRGGVDVRSNHLELSWAKSWQLCNQILVSSALFEKMANLLNILRLSESSNEGRIGLSENLVVNIGNVLCRQDTSNTVFSCLFENKFDEIFCWWITRVWWKIGGNFIHEEQEFQFPIGRLLCQHPIIQFTREFLYKILLLGFVLNRIQVHDVEWYLSGNRRLNK